MTLYRYIKSPAYSSTKSLLLKILPLGFIATGLFLLSLVIYPLFSYKLTLLRWQKEKLVAPVPEVSIAEAKGLISPVSSKEQEEVLPGIKVIQAVDYNLISNWFPGAPVPPVNPSRVTHYALSIPKFKIQRAAVTIGGKRLFDTLIQYPGTAMPGEYGNTVIFGHSVLPTFFSPKDYKSIFSLIPNLKKGDEIILDYDGMQFTYLVENYYEVAPQDIDVLEQRFDQQLLSLVTCVPPGTYLRRGVIQARLAKI